MSWEVIGCVDEQPLEKQQRKGKIKARTDRKKNVRRRPMRQSGSHRRASTAEGKKGRRERGAGLRSGSCSCEPPRLH